MDKEPLAQLQAKELLPTSVLRKDARVPERAWGFNSPLAQKTGPR